MEHRAGALPVEGAVREEIAMVLAVEHWRRSLGEDTAVPEGDYALELPQVQATEEALGVRFPAAVLAIMASRARVLVEGWALRLGAVAEHTASALELGLPGGLLAVGARGSAFVCIEMAAEDAADPWFTIWTPKGGASRQRASHWVSGHVDRVVGDLDVSEADLARLQQPENLARFAPHLVPGGAVEVSPQWVAHAKFGRGRVLRWIDDGAKVEVDFGAAGRRVIASRFVEPQD